MIVIIRCGCGENVDVLNDVVVDHKIKRRARAFDPSARDVQKRRPLVEVSRPCEWSGAALRQLDPSEDPEHVTSKEGAP